MAALAMRKSGRKLSVLGWFQGRMEWGPRALGTRSILGDPRRADMKDIYQIRAEKRPLIPAVTHVDGSGRLQTVYAHTRTSRWCASRRRWIASCGRGWMCWCWGMWWCGGSGELQRGAMAQFLGESAGLSGCRARCVGVALLPANSHGCAIGAVFMPELSRFLGIVIAMYYRDHNPPHFHAVYGECEATFNISTGEVNGFLPRRVVNLIQEWRQLHQQELAEAWALAEARQSLPNIAPLE